MPNDSPLALGYSTPRIFLERQFRFRNRWTVFGAVVVAAFACGFAYASLPSPPRSTFEWVIQTLFGIWSAGMFCFAGYLALAVGMDWEHSVRVSEDGISKNRTLWAWSEIQSVEGLSYANGVSITFLIRLKSIQIPKSIQATPPLSTDDYNELAEILIREIVPHHPHLKVSLKAHPPD